MRRPDICPYLDPPDRAVVLCVDEKSRIQALDRTQPGLLRLHEILKDHVHVEPGGYIGAHL